MPTGTKIKEIRKQKGLTQKQLGDLCGMADSAIRRYENGNANPKIETLQKIADALGCEIFDLLEVPFEPITTDNINNLINISLGSLTNDNEITNKTQPTTLAAHFDGDDFTEEELEEIRKFADYVKSKREPITNLFTGVGRMNFEQKTDVNGAIDDAKKSMSNKNNT